VTPRTSAKYVGLLPFDIHFAHVNDAGQTETRGNGRGGHTMLARAGFRDDARFAHTACEQDLPQTIVDLVRARVVEVFTLQINFRAAQMRRQPLREIEWAFAAHIIFQQIVKFGLKRWIAFRFFIGALKIEHERHQRFGDEASAVSAEMAANVRTGAKGIGRGHGVTAICVARAAETKSRIMSGLFMPGAVSTPEETSTPGALVD